MAIVAMTILAVLIFLLTGSGNIFEGRAKLKTYMQDSAAMVVVNPLGSTTTSSPGRNVPPATWPAKPR